MLACSSPIGVLRCEAKTKNVKRWETEEEKNSSTQAALGHDAADSSKLWFWQTYDLEFLIK